MKIALISQFLFTWCLAICLAGPAFSQEKEKEPLVKVRISAYIWATGDYGDELDRDGNLIAEYKPPEVKFQNASKQIFDMKVYPGRRTPYMTYQGPATLQFFREVEVEGSPDNQRLDVGNVKFPEGTVSALLILYPQDKAMTGFHVYPLLNVSENIPIGKALVYNTCPFEIGAQIGQEAGFQLAAQRSQLVNLTPDQNSFMYTQFWVRNVNQWRRAYGSKKPIHPQSRLIMIVHPKKNRDGTVNRKLVDLLTLSAS
tara:strand:+ start:46 stop:813 length:768 start_codon:yes stop_codon:yes gene_type:complete